MDSTTVMGTGTVKWLNPVTGEVSDTFDRIEWEQRAYYEQVERKGGYDQLTNKMRGEDEVWTQSVRRAELSEAKFDSKMALHVAGGLTEDAQWGYNCNRRTRGPERMTLAEQQAILHPKRKPAKRNSKPAIRDHDDGMLILALRDKVARLERELASVRGQLASTDTRRLQLA